VKEKFSQKIKPRKKNEAAINLIPVERGSIIDLQYEILHGKLKLNPQ